MKKTDLKGIKNMEIKELMKKIKETKDGLAGLFIARAEGAKGSKDIKAVNKKRKDIAQMMTVLRQKELLGELRVKSKELRKESKV